MKQLPVHYFSPTNIVARATVNDEVFDVLNTFVWYLSDVRTPSPPKTTQRIEIKGVVKPKAIMLHRLVWLLHQTDPVEWKRLLGDMKVVYSHLQTLQRLRFLDGCPFNCTIENLDGRLSPRSALKQRVEALKVPPPSAFPQQPEEIDTFEGLPIPLPQIEEPSVMDILKTEEIDSSKPTTVRSLEREPDNE